MRCLAQLLVMTRLFFRLPACHRGDAGACRFGLLQRVGSGEVCCLGLASSLFPLLRFALRHRFFVRESLGGLVDGPAQPCNEQAEEEHRKHHDRRERTQRGERRPDLFPAEIADDRTVRAAHRNARIGTSCRPPACPRD